MAGVFRGSTGVAVHLKCPQCPVPAASQGRRAEEAASAGSWELRAAGVRGGRGGLPAELQDPGWGSAPRAAPGGGTSAGTPEQSWGSVGEAHPPTV